MEKVMEEFTITIPVTINGQCCDRVSKRVEVRVQGKYPDDAIWTVESILQKLVDDYESQVAQMEPLTSTE
jgi:hypothetical protein